MYKKKLSGGKAKKESKKKRETKKLCYYNMKNLYFFSRKFYDNKRKVNGWEYMEWNWVFELGVAHHTWMGISHKFVAV